MRLCVILVTEALLPRPTAALVLEPMNMRRGGLVPLLHCNPTSAQQLATDRADHSCDLHVPLSWTGWIPEVTALGTTTRAFDHNANRRSHCLPPSA